MNPTPAQDLQQSILAAKILIADDEPFIVSLLERLLRSEGYTNIISTSEAPRVEPLHREHDFDLILLDIHMPKLSGLEVLGRLKSTNPSTYAPVIVLTGDTDIETRITALERGARDFLVKPPNKAEVLSRIRNVIEVHVLNRRYQDQREEYQQLLNNILPTYIVERLNAGESEIVDEFENASVMFADLVGFSDACSRIDSRIIIRDLSRIFSAFDQLASKFKVEKIKTIGDAYMAATGMSQSDPDHCLRMADFALATMDRLASLETELAYPFRMRIGIECGSLIAGVLGSHRAGFDVWGDVVNAAARLQAASVPGRVTISNRFAAQIDESFETEPRPDVELRGIGLVEVSFLNRRKG